MCVGLGKAGFSGLGLIAVFIMAELFGKASVGVLLPMLIVADVSVYPMFRKHASWAPVWRLVPPALVGMVIGFFLLDWMPEQWAKPVIGGIILFMVALQLIRQARSRDETVRRPAPNLRRIRSHLRRTRPGAVPPDRQGHRQGIDRTHGYIHVRYLRRGGARTRRGLRPDNLARG